MLWLGAVLVIGLLVVFAGFRKFAAAAVAAVALLGALLYAQNRYEDRRSLLRIASRELGFEDVNLKPVYGNYRLAGRVKNNSPAYTLREVWLVITMQDCAGEGPARQCLTIGESKEKLYLAIPPGQARDFEEPVYFTGGSLKPKGRLEWSYGVTAIRAD